MRQLRVVVRDNDALHRVLHRQRIAVGDLERVAARRDANEAKRAVAIARRGARHNDAARALQLHSQPAPRRAAQRVRLDLTHAHGQNESKLRQVKIATRTHTYIAIDRKTDEFKIDVAVAYATRNVGHSAICEWIVLSLAVASQTTTRTRSEEYSVQASSNQTSSRQAPRWRAKTRRRSRPARSSSRSACTVSTRARRLRVFVSGHARAVHNAHRQFVPLFDTKLTATSEKSSLAPALRARASNTHEDNPRFDVTSRYTRLCGASAREPRNFTARQHESSASINAAAQRTTHESRRNG